MMLSVDPIVVTPTGLWLESFPQDSTLFGGGYDAQIYPCIRRVLDRGRIEH